MAKLTEAFERLLESTSFEDFTEKLTKALEEREQLIKQLQKELREAIQINEMLGRQLRNPILLKEIYENIAKLRG
jgi:HPt (histidine-containing phosphotransfer) domain-containing protein